MTTAPASSRLKHGYSSLQISLHWAVAALVVVNWLLGDAMGQTYDALMRGEEVTRLGGAYSHVAIGLTILLVMVGRLAARRARPVAVAPDSNHKVLATLGRINHITFYVLLILIPIGGAIAWFAGSEAAAGLHELLVTVLLFVVALHVAGALFHHFVLRDGLIRRMLRPTGGT